MQPWLLVGVLAYSVVGAPVQILKVGTSGAGAGGAFKQSSVPLAPLPDDERVRNLIALAVQDALPTGWRINQVTLHGVGRRAQRKKVGLSGALVGAAKVDVRFVGAMAPGEQPISVLVSDAAGHQEAIGANVQLLAPRYDGIVIKRGAEVTVLARSGSVLVQTRGVAQSAAAVGESLVVLCDNATRTLTATAVSPKEVEVRL